MTRKQPNWRKAKALLLDCDRTHWCTLCVSFLSLLWLGQLNDSLRHIHGPEGVWAPVGRQHAVMVGITLFIFFLSVEW